MTNRRLYAPGLVLHLLVAAALVAAIAEAPAAAEGLTEKKLPVDGGATGEHPAGPWHVSREQDHGSIRVAEHPDDDQQRLVHYRKTGDYWYPQMWTGRFDLPAGSTYELSAKLKSVIPGSPFLLRMDTHVDGVRIRLHERVTPGDEFERYRFRFVVPRGSEGVRVGFGPAATERVVEGMIDDVVLRRVADDDADADVTAHAVPGYDEAPHPIQGLEAFMERHGRKPYDLFREENGQLRTHRLIFNDVAHGTEVWMLDDAPTVDHARTASVWPAWNADASRLWLHGSRPAEGGGTGHYFINADYSRLIPRDRGSRPVWDRADPDIYFLRSAGRLFEHNIRTGETRTVAEWDPYPRERTYGFTADNRAIFVDTPNGGIWIPYEPGEQRIPELGLHDGRPAAPRSDGSPSHPRDNSDIMIANRNQVTHTDEWGPLIRVRVGMRIDRETGEIDHVIAPLAGHEGYLRTFNSDRVQWPQGPEWDKYEIHRSDDLDEMFDIYRHYPTMTHGHESPSPDGQFMAKDGTPTQLIRTRDGAIETLRLSPNGSNYHLHWMKHPRFFIGWVRGWRFGDYARPTHGNMLYQVFADLTRQPIFDTNHRLNGYYAGGDFSMLSPDATKVHTASSMTGRFRNYVAVLARPRPPRELTWRAEGDAVVLSWESAAFSRETRGYLVYRSERSGDGYVLQTDEPVRETTWRDADVEPGQRYHYVVTAIEHSGLESSYSAEAARAGVELAEAPADEPLVVYAEAERAVLSLPTEARPGLAVGRDPRHASDWYYLYRHPQHDSGEAALNVRIPHGGDYHLWARVRSRHGDGAAWQLTLGDTAQQVKATDDAWTWVRADRTVTLREGRTELSLATDDAGAAIDLIALATDADFEPTGPRPEDATPPSAVRQLQAENRRDRVNELHWQPSDDPAFSHYHVYASREAFDEGAELDQGFRIGSPTDATFVDWGLRAGQRYHYAVTAVDRRGNESEPSFARATTPERSTEPVTLELAFADAETRGPFERSEAGGLRGEAYLVPEQSDDSRVAWQIDLPHEGEYFLWLRYLQRGSGGRGDQVRQQIRVALDGETLTTLGGRNDLHVRDSLIDPEHPLADRLWTWDFPGNVNLEPIELPAGRHTLALENLHGQVRYDVLLITDEPTFRPDDGRLRQRP